MKTIEIGRDYVAFADKGSLAVHAIACKSSAAYAGNCVQHELMLSPEQLKELLSGKTEELGKAKYPVTYPDGNIKIGCTTVPRLMVAQALDMLTPGLIAVPVGDFEASFLDGAIRIESVDRDVYGKVIDYEEVAVITPEQAKGLQKSFRRAKEIRAILDSVEALERELDELEEQEVDGFEVYIHEEHVAFGCTSVDEITLDEIVALVE